MSDIDVVSETAERAALRRRAERKAQKKTAAAARAAHVEQRSGYVDTEALQRSMAALLLSAAEPSTAARRRDAPAPLAFPASDVNRWVPIGPSVVRRGQAEDSPRVSGRVRDLAVSQDGRRAYAATAKGGVWYTSDGGATWEPLGGWASEPRVFGGNTSVFACGCLLVDFGTTAAADFVMVGTGEIGAFQSSANQAPMRGMGVLVATAPSAQAVNADPWEPATGVLPPDSTGQHQSNSLEGVSIVRMVRVPGSLVGQNNDRVIAATTGGLFLGTRTVSGGSGSFAWAALVAPPPPPPALAGIVAGDPTDLLYVGTRLFVCFRHSGVAVSDNNATSFRWVAVTLQGGLPAASILAGRASIAASEYLDAVYVLGDVHTTPGAANPTPVPHVWRIANPTLAAPATPAATPLGGVPVTGQLWGTQRDYDQAIAVTTTPPPRPPPAQQPPLQTRPAGATDQVYIGGSLIWITNWNAALWAFDVNGNNLVAAAGIAQLTDGADVAGLIGNAVHPDVHTLRTATNSSDGMRQIWVGCDGGVFSSMRGGQTNTFAARNVGLASIEVEFVASHPTSSHFAMLGCQDNGRQVRVGESVWELKPTMQGDGGGVAFHPTQSHIVLGQFIQGNWAADPAIRYVPPIIAPPAPATDPENNRSSFYSGISTVRRSSGNGVRIALGTNRIWITDDLGTANPNTWNVLPFSPPPNSAPASDPRPASRLQGTPAQLRFGVPPNAAVLPGPFGAVHTVKWVNPTTLLALYAAGVIRYTETTPGMWTSTVLFGPGVVLPTGPVNVPLAQQLVVPNGTFFTDLAPVPASNDFYLCCTGQRTQWIPANPATGAAAVPPASALDSCFYYDAVAGGFLRTGLGQALPIVAPALASPIDPVYSVIVDSANSNVAYVGAVTGVWTSTRSPATNLHGRWTPLVNGLPESAVQDLTMWPDTAAPAGSPRLLRAGLQSRGVWEVNLAATETAQTYLRVHERDDRRILPTSMKNPRRRPTAPDVSPLRSPDIKIRPATPVVNTPSFRGVNLFDARFRYQLWTFQTAFRWLYPSVVPDGRWTEQFADLVQRHPRPAGQAAHRRVDANLWTQVMTNAVDENGNPGVYRAPWQNALVPTQAGTEIDLMDTILPRRDSNNIWQVYREHSTVDVLLHHRDTRPVAINESAAVLLWASNRSGNALAAMDCSDIPAFAQSLFTATPLPVPTGWNVQFASDGTALHRLAIPLAARMPRSVEINIDLSAIASGHRVMLLALAGSTVDPFTAVAAGPLDRVDSFVRHWPHAAARLISCWPRPGAAID